MKHRIKNIFKRLYSFFGPQHWWPGKSRFEVVLGAILTQNTNWSNVCKALAVLKKKRLLSALKLYRLPAYKLAALIKSAGYYNIKAARIKNFLNYFFERFSGKFSAMGKESWQTLRGQLLAVKGIGPETADSILLYALQKPVFVVDAYTKRIFRRHGLISDDADYSRLQNLFTRNLGNDARLFNEYHALLVRLGKDFCRKQNPKCKDCPLWPIKKD